MAEKTMQTLRIVGNPLEAEIMCTRLDAAGILAVVNGSETATMLSHVGYAVSRVRVEVAPEDFDRASEILEADDYERTQRKQWVCSRCEEPNEPLFDFCWSCNKHREGDESEPRIDEPIVEQVPEPPIDALHGRPQPQQNDNPYAPIAIPAGEPENGSLGRRLARHRSSDELQDWDLEETVDRILRGAVFSIFIAPPLLTAYVVFSLLSKVPKAAYSQPAYRRKLIASWCLCGISLFTASFILAML